jgi:uncharacterized protein (TIRG00374 family)
VVPFEGLKDTPKRPWIRPLLAVIGYTAILALAWRAIDHAALVEGLGRLRAHHILVVLAIALLHVAGRAFRFHRLMLRAAPDATYGIGHGFRIFLIGLSTSAVTPARAGDFIKAELVRRFGVSRSVGLGVVMVERMLDLLVITTAILVTGATLSTRRGSGGWQTAASVLLVLLVLGVVVISTKSIRSRLLRPIIARFKRLTVIEGAFQVWDTVFTSPASFLAYGAWSALVWSIEFVKLWVVLRYLGANVEVASVLFVYPVSIVAGILTLLPFSEGVVGVTGVALLGTIAGVDSATATIAVVVDRGASSLPPMILWGVFALAGRFRGEPEPVVPE